MKKKSLILSSLLCLFSYGSANAQNVLQLHEDNIDEVIKAMTIDEKCLLLAGAAPVDLVPGSAGGSPAIERLGIPPVLFADGPAGLRILPTRKGVERTFFTTGFPIGTLMASSWDVNLMEEVTSAMGNEVLEFGIDLLLGPGMNIHRNPLCGRNFEYFSEDPVLSGKMAAAYVRGIQSNGVGACLKHFAANNQETNRQENDARIGERALREIYLKNFEIAAKESDPWTVMSSYNVLNGEYTQQSKKLLTDILRHDWKYQGLVMSDWGKKDGTVKAAKAGNDLMEPGSNDEVERLKAAVMDGTLSQEELDRNVRNVLKLAVRSPRFKNYKYSENPDLKVHAAIARKAAAESIVLLRNEGNALPLKGNEKVALYGVGSVAFHTCGEGSGHVANAHPVSMDEALRSAGFQLNELLSEYYNSYVTNVKVRKKWKDDYEEEEFFICGWDSRFDEVPIPQHSIARQAESEDVAIVVFSRNAGEGTDRLLKNDFELSEVERELLQMVNAEFHAQGKKVIVVLNVGGVMETASWRHLADAIVLPWQPGQEGAHAVVDVLAGKVNPSGKLPMTFPINFMDTPSSRNFPYYAAALVSGKNYDYTNYDEGIWVGYRHFATHDMPVSYPFGFGLSYTHFSYSKPIVKAVADGFEASITVTNDGTVAAGKETVQLYVHAPEGGLEKPVRELKAFAKTRLLAPGEKQVLTMKVSNYDLASFNENSYRWEAPAGNYTVQFAASSEDIRQTGTYKLKKALSWEVFKAM